MSKSIQFLLPTRMIKVFHFTQGEKRAILILMILVLVFIGGYSSFNYFAPKREVVIHRDTIYREVAMDTRGYEKKSPSRKFTEKTPVNLNFADTTQLKKIPGIGSVFAQRIVEYRTWLGGFHSLDQLQEVKGIGEIRLKELKKWLYITPGSHKTIDINQASFNELNNHIYFNISLIRPIKELQEHGMPIKDLDELSIIYPFDRNDITRLAPYLSFGSE